MSYETFVVEIGCKEIFVEVSQDKRGNVEFYVDAGTDWEGFPVPLSTEERKRAIDWVKQNYGVTA